MCHHWTQKEKSIERQKKRTLQYISLRNKNGIKNDANKCTCTTRKKLAIHPLWFCSDW